MGTGDRTPNLATTPQPDASRARQTSTVADASPTTESTPPNDAGTATANQGSFPSDADPTYDAQSPVDTGLEELPVSRCSGQSVEGPNESCYLFLNNSVAWAEARQLCLDRGEGWYLVHPRSQEESSFLAQNILVQTWIGASDGANEGTWVWGSDNQIFWVGDGTTGQAVAGRYTNWNGNEPNGGTGSLCARAIPPSETIASRQAPWADIECTDLKSTACQGPLLVE